MSPRRPRIILLAQTRADIRDIQQYTRITWGVEQARLYKADLARALRQLAAFPESGVARDDLGPRFRSKVIGSHVIYYRFDDDSITVIRILHGRQDPIGKLPG